MSAATDPSVAALLATCPAAGRGGERRVGGAGGPLVRPVTFGERSGVVARAARGESPPAAVAAGLLVTALLEPGTGVWSEDVERQAEIVVLLLAGAEVEAPSFATTRALAVLAGLEPQLVDATAAAEVDHIAAEVRWSGGGAVPDSAIETTTTVRRIVLVGTPACGLDTIRDELADRLLRRASADTPRKHGAAASATAALADPGLAGAPGHPGATGAPLAAAWPDAPPWPGSRPATRASTPITTASASRSTRPQQAESLAPESPDGGSSEGLAIGNAAWRGLDGPAALRSVSATAWSHAFGPPSSAGAPFPPVPTGATLSATSRASGAWPRTDGASWRHDYSGLAAELHAPATAPPLAAAGRVADPGARAPHAWLPPVPSASLATPVVRPPALRAADLADALAALLETEADLRGLD